MMIMPNLTTQMWDTQLEALKEVNITSESLQGMDKQLELEDNRT